MRINEKSECYMGCNKKTWLRMCVVVGNVALMYGIMASRCLVPEIFLVRQDQQKLQNETLFLACNNE